jgi:hypothetical protein
MSLVKKCQKVGYNYFVVQRFFFNSQIYYKNIFQGRLFSFTGMTKILVVNGQNVGSKKMEIVDLSDPTNVCRPSFLDEYPLDRVIAASGGLLTNNNVLMICGGRLQKLKTILDDCFSITAENGPTTTTAKLSQPRSRGASVVLNNTTLWLTGGWLEESTELTKSTEFVQLTGTIPGPDLPFEVSAHCLVLLNDTTALLIGGQYPNTTSSKATSYFNFEDKIWTVGPSLMTGRYIHSCALFKSPQYGNTDTVIVTGGHNELDNASTSTEILNFYSNNPSWTSGIIICNYYIQITVSNSIVTYILWYCVFAGSNVPEATKKSKMVPTPDGTGVVLIGGTFTRQDLYELKCSSSSCNWSLMEQRLSVERFYHNAFYVPDGFAVCEN